MNASRCILAVLVIACPQCLKQFDIAESDLLPGVRVGSAGLTGEPCSRTGRRP